MTTPDTTCAFQEEIESFVAERADEFEVQLPQPWHAALSSSDFPRPLLDDLYAATVAAHAAQALASTPSVSPHDAIEQACDALPQPWGLAHNRNRLQRRASVLLLRAQVRGATMPEDLPPALAAQIRALQAHWEAKTAALDSFARALDAIGEEHGEGLALSGNSAREQQQDINRSAYAALRRCFVEHHSAGMSRLDLDDQEIQSLVLAPDPASVSVFTPVRAFGLLHAQFGRTAQTLLHQQIADAFVETFWLCRNTELRTQRGRVVMELRVWIDAIDKTHLRRIRYSFDSRSRIEKALRALADLWLQGREPAEAATADEAVKACLQTFEAADWSPGPALRPSLLGVELRCYQGRIDVLVPETLAAQINAFVTLHSKRLRERDG